jgi:3-carboxy-cis,cis-muconate cycloisomerase
MRANLNLTHGLIMAESLATALALRAGHDEAFRIVRRLCDRAVQSRTALRDLAASDEQVCALLTPEHLARAFDTSAYLGSADVFIQRALEGFYRLRVGT